jgi:Protein of unknown function (DUF3179)
VRSIEREGVRQNMVLNLRGVFLTGLCGLATLLVFLAPRFAEAQPPANIEEKAKPNLWSSVTDPKSGIAGAELIPGHSAAFAPLNDPEWRGATAADYMRPEDRVLGFSFHGKSWAVPIWVMFRPHVANLVVDGEPLVISYCAKCRGGIARQARVPGKRLTFYVTGTYNGSILVADYETKSYWTPFTGEALEGELKGTKLPQVPLIQCSWSRWIQMHPDTLVLYRSWSPRPTGLEAHVLAENDLYMPTKLIESVLHPIDERLPLTDWILGVAVGDQARAYPLTAIDRGPESKQGDIALNDTIGNKPVVILHARDQTLANAFYRQFRGQTLVFSTDRDGRFVDSTFHSHWNYQGEALDGPMAGQKLAYIPSQVEDWYIWAAYHPATTIYRAESGGGAGSVSALHR